MDDPHKDADDHISTCGDAAQFFACFPSDRPNLEQCRPHLVAY
jgi:hypothetical protein